MWNNFWCMHHCFGFVHSCMHHNAGEYGSEWPIFIWIQGWSDSFFEHHEPVQKTCKTKSQPVIKLAEKVLSRCDAGQKKIIPRIVVITDQLPSSVARRNGCVKVAFYCWNKAVGSWMKWPRWFWSRRIWPNSDLFTWRRLNLWSFSSRSSSSLTS